jgi:hypothetical protein
LRTCKKAADWATNKREEIKKELTEVEAEIASLFI